MQDAPSVGHDVSGGAGRPRTCSGLQDGIPGQLGVARGWGRSLHQTYRVSELSVLSVVASLCNQPIHDDTLSLGSTLWDLSCAFLFPSNRTQSSAHPPSSVPIEVSPQPPGATSTCPCLRPASWLCLLVTRPPLVRRLHSSVCSPIPRPQPCPASLGSRLSTVLGFQAKAPRALFSFRFLVGLSGPSTNLVGMLQIHEVFLSDTHSLLDQTLVRLVTPLRGPPVHLLVRSSFSKNPAKLVEPELPALPPSTAAQAPHPPLSPGDVWSPGRPSATILPGRCSQNPLTPQPLPHGTIPYKAPLSVLMALHQACLAILNTFSFNMSTP